MIIPIYPSLGGKQNIVAFHSNIHFLTLFRFNPSETHENHSKSRSSPTRGSSAGGMG